MRMTIRLLLLLLLPILPGCKSLVASYERGVLRELSLHSYDEGMRFAEEGNYQIALDRFNRSVTIDPRPASYFQLGRTYEQLGMPEEAAEAYLSALREAPDFQEARFALLALGYQAPGELEIKSDPERLVAFAEELSNEAEIRRLARAEEEAQMTDEERRRLQEQIRMRMALAAEERMPTLNEVQAVLFPAGGESDPVAAGSGSDLAADREIILNTYPYHFANAQRFQRNREYEKAASEYQRALNADPDQIEARLNLGDVMMQLQRYPQALFHYTTALEQFPESPRPLLKLGNYYDTLAQGDLARDYYRRALGKDPTYVEAMNNLAAMEIRERNYEEAIRLLRSLTEISPGYTLAYMNLGIAYENSGNSTAALDAYRSYIDLGGERAAEVRQWVSEME